ncbi:unnamed protein product [Oppiella nova]|uniref:cysteine desulfurase n=1 Tax=Oppiella nova TaxID=334625 RepID=A0A7R9QF65_9ACAR|nr:unnamed protein product [Oppiella nova]CAG2164543.1 unnamed protein product [Oppiella nova]
MKCSLNSSQSQLCLQRHINHVSLALHSTQPFPTRTTHSVPILHSLSLHSNKRRLSSMAKSDNSLRALYLDAQSTTPLDPRVLDAMMPYMVSMYGNPHSRTHSYGWESEKATEEARQSVADIIGADPKEIIFTSGATESNNIALKGCAKFYKDKRDHIITTQTEHKCVLDSCRYLENEGFRVTYLPVQSTGIIDMNVLREAINDRTVLVSIMTVNNEIGVKQPIKEIGGLCRSKGVFFHTDAAQAVGKIPLNVNDMNIDLMSISGHKIYGPKVIRNGDPNHSYPGCVNLSFAYVEGESLLMALKDVALSSGSACTSASLEPSYVLRAIGSDEDLAHSSIRFGIGRFTTIEEVDYTVEKCIHHVKRLRAMSPLWEMVEEGIDIKTIKWSQH